MNTIHVSNVRESTKAYRLFNHNQLSNALMMKWKHPYISLLIIAIFLTFVSNPGFAAPPNINITNNTWLQNEPMVAINPLDHAKLVVGFNDNRSAGNFGVGWSWSDDGGNNWTSGGKFSFTGYTRGADPVVAFDNMGKAYMVGLAYNPDASPSLGRDGSIFVATSNDGGHTFPEANRRIIVSGNGTATYYDKPWLYVNPVNNDIYVTWVKRSNAWGVGGTESMVIEFTRSSDGGANFSPPIQVSNFSNTTGTNRTHGPQIAGVSGNHIYVSWHTLEAGTLPNPPTTPWKIWIAESTDSGVSFGTTNLVATTAWGYPINFISMSADPVSGRIYIVYADSLVQTPRDYDIFLTSASSAAGPWSSPLRINNDPQNGRWQFFPSLAIAPNGRVDVMWYDYRDDPNRLNVYYRYSRNGGSTWSANIKLTDNPGFTPDNANFAGDYNGVASVDDKAYMVWMDNRLGNQEIYGTTFEHVINTSPLSPPQSLQIQQ